MSNIQTEIFTGPIRVLLIEDDRLVAGALQRTLERAGMLVEWASSGAAAHTRKANFLPHVALVDVRLPDASGLDLIGWLVANGNCGVIMLTGANDETDRVVGLELGADDYMAKPPCVRELIARIRAVHRRIRAAPQFASQPTGTRTLDAGPFRIDFDARTVLTTDGKYIHLTSAEFMVLEALSKAMSHPVTRSTLSERALRRTWQPEDRAVDQLIFALRSKLPNDAYDCSLIQSIRGLGYVLRVGAPGETASAAACDAA